MAIHHIFTHHAYVFAFYLKHWITIQQSKITFSWAENFNMQCEFLLLNYILGTTFIASQYVNVVNVSEDYINPGSVYSGKHVWAWLFVKIYKVTLNVR